jgi:hypothetical protein
MRGCGRIERPAFPAPSDLQTRKIYRQNSRMRGEIAKVCVQDPTSLSATNEETFAQESNATKQYIFDLAMPSRGLLRLRRQ